MLNRSSDLSRLRVGLVAGSRVLVVLPAVSGRRTAELAVQACMDRGCAVSIVAGQSPIALDSMRVSGITVRSASEILGQEDEAAVVRAACDLAQKWFVSGDLMKRLEWQGVKLGELLERLLPGFALIRAVRLVHCSLAWIEREQPDAIVLLEPYSELSVAFRQGARQAGVPVVVATSGSLLHRLTSLLRMASDPLRITLLDLRDLVARAVWAWWRHASVPAGQGPARNSEPTALFVGFDPTHYKHLLPVGERLERSGWRVKVLRGLVGTVWRAEDGVRWPGQRVDTVDGYVTVRLWLQYRRARRWIRDLWKRLERDGTLQDRFVYQGVSLWPLLKRDLRALFQTYLPAAARYLDLTRRIIDLESPAVLILGNDSCTRGRAMVAAARQRGVSTLVVQHGLPAEPWDYVPYSDRMAVWGESSRAAISHYGAPADRLVCTGAPGLDDLAGMAGDELLLEERRISACRHLGLGDSRDLILLLSSHSSGTDQDALLEMVFRVARRLAVEDRLVVKLHPAESDEKHQEAASRVGIRPLVVKDVDLWGAIAASRVVITSLNSTVGVEALLLRKPVIAVRTGEFASVFSDLPECIYEVGNESELERRLVALLSAPTTRRTQSLEWLLGPLDGGAAERVADQVETRKVDLARRSVKCGS